MFTKEPREETSPKKPKSPVITYILLLLRLCVYCFALIGFAFVSIYFAVRLGFTDTKGKIDSQSSIFLNNKGPAETYASFPLAHTKEWVIFRQAVAKDMPTIQRVSKETGVDARLIVAVLVPEQMRLFHSQRAIFKEAFAPLKILGSQSQFSWGIFGIKDETARDVESHLLDTQSPYYLGEKFRSTLSFTGTTTDDIDKERFERIVDEHNHYYGYLYAALYIKQIEAQWKKASFPIENNPAVIATLWNLGFTKSAPHANPLSGGAEIDINGASYSFGSLANAFYYSDEMIELLPYSKIP